MSRCRVPSHLRDTQYLSGQLTHSASQDPTMGVEGTGSFPPSENTRSPVASSASRSSALTTPLSVMSLGDTTHWSWTKDSCGGKHRPEAHICRPSSLAPFSTAYPSRARGVELSPFTPTSAVMPSEVKNSSNLPTFFSHLPCRSSTRRSMFRCTDADVL